MPAMAAGARSLAATGHAGRRSGRGCVPTLERGNEQRRGSRVHRVHRRPERTRAVVGAKNFSPLRIPSRIVTNGAHDAPFTNTRKRLFVRRVRRAHHVRGALRGDGVAVVHRPWVVRSGDEDPCPGAG